MNKKANTYTNRQTDIQKDRQPENKYCDAAAAYFIVQKFSIVIIMRPDLITPDIYPDRQL